MPTQDEIILNRLAQRQRRPEQRSEFQIERAPQAIMKALYTLGSGKQYQEPKTVDTDAALLDRMIKMNTLETGSADFKRDQYDRRLQQERDEFKWEEQYKKDLEDQERADVIAARDEALQTYQPEKAQVQTQVQTQIGAVPRVGGAPQMQPSQAIPRSGVQQEGGARYITKPSSPVWSKEERRYITPPPEVVESPEFKSALDVAEKRQMGQIEAEEKSAGARIMKQGSAHMVGSAMKRLADGWVEAYKEKGVGDIGRDFFYNQVAERIGGNVQDMFPKTAALPGLKTEIVAKMMPLLTQQGDEKGSVRLVESIFRKLEKTLPGGSTGPVSAKEMMTATIRNMYGVSKAYQESGLTADQVDQMPEEAFNDYVNFLYNSGEQIIPSPEEEEAMQSLIQSSLGSFDEILDGEQKTMFASNPQTGEKIVSNDGGQTWQPRQ